MLFLLNGELSPILGAETTAVEPAPVAQEGTQAVTPAPAPQAQPAGLLDMWWMYGIWIAVIVGFYFLTIRPQRNREKKMKEMQSSIKPGDNIVTSGGMFGRVADVGEDCFVVEFGTNRGVRIPIRKSDVLGIQSPKTTPAPKIETKDD